MNDRPPFPRPVELLDSDESSSATDTAASVDPGAQPSAPESRSRYRVRPAVADGIDYPLDPAYKTVRRLASLIFQTIFWGGAFIALIVAALTLGMPQNLKRIAFAAWFVLAALGVVRAVLWPSIAYRFISYRVTDRLFRFRHGVLWRSVISVPKTRVQHTDVSQGPLQRSFGIATLIVHTAGTENASVSLGGLPHEKALKIRDHLIDGGGDDAV